MNQKNKSPKFPKAHLWLLIPLFIVLLGFYSSYWSKFSVAPFRQHVHGLTATAWFLLLTMQPWLYNNKPLSYHRKVGFIGLFLAGGVVFTAFQLLPFNNQLYGITFHNICALIGFSTSIVMAMLNSKEYPIHARWMISSAFWVLQPAVGRLLYFGLRAISSGEPVFSRGQLWYIGLSISIIPLLTMMYIDYKKEAKIYKPYLLTLIGVTIATTLVATMNTTTWWVKWCQNVLGQGT